jgi:hypothetical protein
MAKRAAENRKKGEIRKMMEAQRQKLSCGVRENERCIHTPSSPPVPART